VIDTATFVEVCLLVQLLLSIARVGCSTAKDVVVDGVVSVAPFWKFLCWLSCCCPLQEYFLVTWHNW
jgi:hypothetical protein